MSGRPAYSPALYQIKFTIAKLLFRFTARSKSGKVKPRRHIFFSHFTFFIESKRTKTVGKQNTRKTEQRNSVEHKAIILKDKRQEKTNTFHSMYYQIQ